MGRLLMRRLLGVIPVILMVAIAAFALTRLIPGDPAALLAGDTASPADVARIRERLGLDQPLVTQFLIWAGEALGGDFGRSLFYRRPVTELILQRFEPTVALALATTVMSLLIAIPLGTLAAARRGSWLDRFASGLSVVGFGVPAFVSGYVLAWLFALEWPLLPVQGYRRLEDGVGPWLASITLPTATLCLVYVALLARVTRAAVIEVLDEDFVKTARAKGATERRVLLRHALRNAANPILTAAGTGFAFLIGGVVVVETVFNIPGLGRLLVDAVLARDYAVVQAVILLLSVVYVAINTCIDLGYMGFDPRIKV